MGAKKMKGSSSPLLEPFEVWLSDEKRKALSRRPTATKRIGDWIDNLKGNY
jgi:hypothetical protein